ncbi:MAG: hypothetical protein AB1411_03845 [Nitrospirota bacterium]
MKAPILGTVTILAILAMPACTKLQTYHAETPAEPCRVTADRQGGKTCAYSSLVQRTYTAGKLQQEHDYYMAFVEFDDQGWFREPKQMERLLDFLNRSQKDEDFIIIVYAHGWRHNADACDNNVQCFQSLLERLDFMERTLMDQSRKVVGVYVGWRGLSATLEPFESMSFWDRKNTAQEVGLGGVTELLARLNEFRSRDNPRRKGLGTHLIVTGHSFGAKVIYSALSHGLTERAIPRQAASLSPAKSFGDLVILINPAFEGALYEPLHRVAVNRCYPERQRPVMMVVNSKADWATRFAFPFGRTFSTLFESTSSDEQGEALVRTVGHMDRYVTHELSLMDGKEPIPKTGDTGTCGCPYLAPIKDFVADFERQEGEEWQFYKALVEEKRRFAPKKPSPGSEEKSADPAMDAYIVSEDLNRRDIAYGDRVHLTRFTKVREYEPNHPYFVVSTDEKLIPGHNEIYGEDVTNFVRRFYIRHIMERINFPPGPQCKAPLNQ